MGLLPLISLQVLHGISAARPSGRHAALGRNAAVEREASAVDSGKPPAHPRSTYASQWVR